MAEYQVSQIYEGLKESDLYILTEFFKMLGNPARIRILLLLMGQGANVRDLAEQPWNVPVCGAVKSKKYIYYRCPTRKKHDGEHPIVLREDELAPWTSGLLQCCGSWGGWNFLEKLLSCA